MKRNPFIVITTIVCAWFALSDSRAATIPAGTTLTVKTVSLITSKDVVGRSFEAKIAHDIGTKGGGVLRAGTKTFGKIRSSRANPRRSEPLTVELASVSVNGRNVAVKTNTVRPEGPPSTARQLHYGHTAGTTVVNPGTTLQFQLVQPLMF